MVIPKSADGARVSLSVAELLDGFGSVIPPGAATVAVFTRVPRAVLATVAVTVMVAEPPDCRLTDVLMFPPPLGAPQLEPAVAVQVQIAFVRIAARLSVTLAEATALGPSLVTTMEYTV